MPFKNLSKEETISLDKEELESVIIGLGWDAADNGDNYDLDASAFMLASSGKVRTNEDLIYYGNLNRTKKEPIMYDVMNVGVVHRGDDITGKSKLPDIIEINGRKDSEQIFVDLLKIPSDIVKIVFTVTIYKHDVRKQNFGQVNNAYIRIIDCINNEVITNFDLTEDYSTKTAIIAGALQRKASDDEWEFHAIGEGREGGLRELCNEFGVKVR